MNEAAPDGAQDFEAVDFYSGHKETLAYLGTIWVPDGSPEGIRARQRFSDESLPEGELFTGSDFLAAVEQLMAHLTRQLGQSHGVDLQLGQHIGQSVLAQATLGQLQNGLVVR